MSKTGRMTFDSPGAFEVRILGTLDARWSDYLGDVSIDHISTATAFVSELHGRFQDQAALIGVLNALYNLGFPLLSCTCMDFEDTADSSSLRSSE